MILPHTKASHLLLPPLPKRGYAPSERGIQRVLVFVQKDRCQTLIVFSGPRGATGGQGGSD